MVLWLRALGHEFVQIARAIIHVADKLEKNSPTPHLIELVEVCDI